MNLILLLLSLVMIACILCNKLTSKIGIPMPVSYTHLTLPTIA